MYPSPHHLALVVRWSAQQTTIERAFASSSPARSDKCGYFFRVSLISASCLFYRTFHGIASAITAPAARGFGHSRSSRTAQVPP